MLRKKDSKSQSGWRTPGEQCSKQGAYELTETEAASTGPSWTYTRSCLLYYSYLLSIFMGLLSVRMSGSLALMPFLGSLFLQLSCYVQLFFCFILLYFIFCFIFLFLIHLIIFYFVMFGCYLLEACSFLIRNRKALDLEERGIREV